MKCALRYRRRAGHVGGHARALTGVRKSLPATCAKQLKRSVDAVIRLSVH